MKHGGAGTRYTPRCGVLSRAHISADMDAPCVLASQRVSRSVTEWSF
jgi:hypothetical protein